MVIKSGDDTAQVYGKTHPYTYMSYIFDTAAELYGYKVKVTCVTIRGRRKIHYYEVPELFESGNLCVNIDVD